MKLFSALLTISLLTIGNISRLAAQSTAFDSLQTYFSVAPFEVSVPAPTAPLLNKAVAPDPSLSGEGLFQYLHTATTPAPKFQPSYSASKSFMYSKADNTGCNGGPGIITFYSQVCASGSSADGNSYHEQGDQNGDGVVDKIVNAEHLWPQSYFNSSLPMVADLHHLQSTFATPNGRRANLNFAMVSNASYSTSSGSKLGKEGFEPADAVKGNVARALLYFVVRYYDKSIRQGLDYNNFWVKRVPMFLEWNKQDPPDANERRRNDLIEQFQGNRNPFVDDPSLADKIGAAVLESH